VVRQRSPRDCGVAAAAMVVARWRGAPAGRAIVAEHRPGERLRATEVRDLLRDHGLRAYVVEGRHADLEHELARGRPVIVGTIKPWSNGRGYRHYEVVVALRTRDDAVVTIDPAQGWRLSSWDAFEREWAAAAHTTIVALPAP
jgi:ABC-type bacteriocin/lantibiotic exporter with double-glycine peptidase domain